MTTMSVSQPYPDGNAGRMLADLPSSGAANEWIPKTIEEKAAFYGELAIWSEIPWMPLSLLCVSPVSGNKYRIDYDAVTGRTRCNCRRGMAHRECWHSLFFTGQMLAALWRKFRATEHSLPVTHPGDFDEDVRLASSYRCEIGGR